MDVVLCQVKTTMGDVEKNLEIIEDTVRNTPGDMYIFPEMFLTGYMIRDKVWELAMSENSDHLRKVGRLADDLGVYIIGGFPKKDPIVRGRIYNSAFIAYPDGEIYTVDKIYLPNFGPFEEKLYFTPGNEMPLFTLSNGFRVAITICYDLFFPEIYKYYALMGADMIINISASPTTSRKFFETLLPARAIENTVYIAYVNNTGNQDTLEFWGGSRVISPRGNEVVRAGYLKEEVVTAEVSSEEIELARRLRPTLRDSRPEILSAWGME